MNKELFNIPSANTQQRDFDVMVAEINAGLKLIIQAALNFDTCYKLKDWFCAVDDTCRYFDDDDYETVEDYTITCKFSENEDAKVSLALSRNLHTSTQRIFGFAFCSPRMTKFKHSATITEIYLKPSDFHGPAIASTLLKYHKIRCYFDTNYYAGEENVPVGIWSIIVHAEMVPFNETIEELRKIKSDVDAVVDEIHEIELLCKLTGSFSAYLDYLKYWETDNANLST